MQKDFKYKVGFFFLTLSIALIPSAAIVESAGHKNLAHYLLWGSSISLTSTLVTVASMRENQSKKSHIEQELRLQLEDYFASKHPGFSGPGLMESGVRFTRRIVRHSHDQDDAITSRIDPDQVCLTFLYLYQAKALKLFKREDNSLVWLLNWHRVPRLSQAKFKRKNKCVGCQYWVDNSAPNELNCAVNPLHTDTVNGCKEYVSGNTELELQKCLSKQIVARKIRDDDYADIPF